jgi:hypothetical protein
MQNLPLQIEMMVARWTNWPPIPPFAWQRGLVGMLLGAVPHAFEGLLGYLIDYAEADNYYSQQRSARFNKRHPGERMKAGSVMTETRPGWLMLSRATCCWQQSLGG